jgi:thioredoxin reductase (NADPH)
MNHSSQSTTNLISPADIDREPEAFPSLTDEDLVLARSCGSTKRRAVGEALFVDGDRHVDFFVVLSGRVEILDTSGEGDRPIVIHGSDAVIGDINLFLERPVHEVPIRAWMPRHCELTHC